MEILLKKINWLAAAFIALSFVISLAPSAAYATTCGTGSNISFTDIGGGLCQGYITSIGAGTFTVPSDWNSSNNQVACIGSGGDGYAGDLGSGAGGAGGGGGAYASTTNVTLTSGGSASYRVGGGTDTYFNGAASSSASVSCSPGTTASGSTPGTGGKTTTSTGTVKSAGGTGGTPAGFGGGGGGGAGGPHGTGGTGGNATGGGGGGGGGADGGSNGSNSSSNNGANGGNGYGGTGAGTGDTTGGGGGSSTSGTGGGGGGGKSGINSGGGGGAGSYNTSFDATHGPSGGGGGAGGCTSGNSGVTPGNGGTTVNYGGGGGGGGAYANGIEPCGSSLEGGGGQGLIVIIYSPLVPPSITTSAASANNATSATFNGSVTATGGAAATTCGFAWGTNSSLSGGDTATTTDSTCPGSTGAFTKGQVPLVARTTYYFRAYGINTGGTGYGSILSFSLSRGALAKPPNNLGLVGYWPMNEATSTQAGDFSGNGSTGTLTTGGTGLPLWVTGKRGSALSFSGTNDTYVSVGNKSALDIASAGTVSAWIKKSSSVAFAPVASKMNWSTDRNGYGIFFDSNGTKLDVDLDNGSSAQSVNSNATISNGVWYHVAYTWDGSTVRIYINGAEDKNTPQTVTPTPSSQSFYIGSANSGDNFDGIIDEVRVYSRALSPTEISSLYGNGAGSPAAGGNASSKTLQNGTTLGSGLQGLWTFDGGAMNWSTSKAYDVSGNVVTGTLNGITQSSVAIGKLGQALSFNGSTSYIDLGNPSALKSNSCTVAAWVKTTNDSDSNLFAASQGAANGHDFSIELGPSSVDLTNELITVFYQNGGISDHEVAYATATRTELFDGAWHHVVITEDGSATAIYLDGVSKSLSVVRGDVGSCTGQDATLDTFRIGNGRFGGSDFNFFSGSMDDVRFYNRALSATEVSQLYKLGKVLVKP